MPDIACPPAEDWREQASFLRRCVEQKVRSVPTYRVAVKKLTATDYGTAQNRSRVFIVGIRDDLTQEWQAPDMTHSHDRLMHEKWVTGEYWDRHGLERPVMDKAGLAYMRKHNQRGMEDLFSQPLRAHRTTRDALVGLPEPTAEGTSGILDHQAAPREAKAYKGHTGSPIDDPSKTLRAGDHGVSGGENMIDLGPLAGTSRYRHFTVREAARIQDFPDDYTFPQPEGKRGKTCAWSSSLKQLGNAVPCALAQAMGDSIAKVLRA